MPSWFTDSLSWIDTVEQVVHTEAAGELRYDALLLAVGGRMTPAFEHVKTFRDADADALFGGVVQDLEGGYSKTIAFLAPEGPMWLLPLYELALMTAERVSCAGFDDVEFTLVTPEPWPLAGFGRAASDAVGKLLEDAGIAVYSSALAQVPAKQQLLIQPQGIELSPDRMIAMPRVSGPASAASQEAATRTGFSPSTATAPSPAPRNGSLLRATPRRSRSSTAASALSRPTLPPRRSPCWPASRTRQSLTGRSSAESC